VYNYQHFNADSAHSPFVAFKNAYSQRFGDAPGFASTYSNEAVSIIVEALRKNAETSSIKESIVRIRQFKGLQGDLAIDRFGDPERSHFLMQVRNGKFAKVD
jgi:branched-chain amino acid transport system substrate-binding protein